MLNALNIRMIFTNHCRTTGYEHRKDQPPKKVKNVSAPNRLQLTTDERPRNAPTFLFLRAKRYHNRLVANLSFAT